MKNLDIRRIVLLGPPGVGKGTQAKRLHEMFNWAHISTGDILRDSVREGTSLGKKAKTFMGKGELVPDEIILDLVGERLKEANCHQGFILDGFPRTVVQAEKLDGLLSRFQWALDGVVSIDGNKEKIVKRLSQRLVCGKCGHVVQPNSGAKSGEPCPECDGRIIRRKDDEPETILKRLDVYEKQTHMLIKYYEGRKLLLSVNGLGSIDEVYNRILDVLGLSSGAE
jgi:adenylate kinase